QKPCAPRTCFALRHCLAPPPCAQRVKSYKYDCALSPKNPGGLTQHLMRVRGKIGCMVKQHQIHGVSGEWQFVSITNDHSIRYAGTVLRRGYYLLGKVCAVR